MSHTSYRGRFSRSPHHSPNQQQGSDNFTPPAPVTHLSPDPSTRFMAGHSPVPPPSVPAHQYASFAPQPTYLDPYHSSPPTSNPHLVPTTFQSIHPPPSPQPSHADWPSAGIHSQQDSKPIHHSLSLEQQTPRLPPGRTSTFRQPSPSSPSGLPQFPGSNVGTPDARAHYVDDQLPPLNSQHQSIPEISVHSTAHPTHHLPSTQRFAHPREHSFSSTPTVPFYPPPLSPELIFAIQGPNRPGYLNQGSFNHAHHFTMTNPVFIDYHGPEENFMEKLLRHTIIGAEFDSSARDPPPRCHPGTRLKIIERCLNFIIFCSGKEKLRWVVGPVGVGKSAVMQMIAEQAPDGAVSASVFLSVNERRDGSKIILTIAYQLAVKYERYRQFIQDEISRDPALLQKSLSVQFNKFIVEPFIHQHLFDSPRRSLIVIDGLDESDNPDTQLKLLELITDFCISYPTSPIAWIVASRPEAHITSFFDDVEIQPAYIKEEMEIDSDEACEDVRLYLRDELNKIKLAKSSLRRQREWPSELEFTMIASAAGGLFAYAVVVVRYINDHRYRDPTAQLCHILKIIKGIPLADASGSGHPMARLDALYARILSNIPDDVMISVKAMLLLYSESTFKNNFRLLCNFLGSSEEAAYGAVSYLYAVMRVPEADEADGESLEIFHKSFEDFLLDFERSGFSPNQHDEAEQLMARHCLNIIAQVPYDSDDLANGGGINCYLSGVLRGGPDVSNSVSLSWPGDERFEESDADLKRDLYHKSMVELSRNVHRGGRLYCESMSCFQALTTRFVALGRSFPFVQLRDSAFGTFRHQLAELGKLKEVSLQAFNFVAIFRDIELSFVSPIGTNVDLSNPWNPLCKHEKEKLDSLQQRQGWKTKFERPEPPDSVSEDISDTLSDGSDTDIGLYCIKPCHRELLFVSSIWHCSYCSRRFIHHFISNPDLLATCFVDCTGLSYVECSFVDPDDGVSEWRYRFCHSGPPKRIDV